MERLAVHYTFRNTGHGERAANKEAELELGRDS